MTVQLLEPTAQQYRVQPIVTQVQVVSPWGRYPFPVLTSFISSPMASSSLVTHLVTYKRTRPPSSLVRWDCKSARLQKARTVQVRAF
jgi:hypothetical protein